MLPPSHNKCLNFSTKNSGGLLSLFPVHAERRDGEDLLGGAMIWNGVKPYVVAAASVGVCLTI